MRQLVSIVNDQGLAYFVSDGDDAQQIAQLINPGLEVADVIRLGVNLIDALQLNGETTHAPQPTAVTKTKTKPEPRELPERVQSFKDRSADLVQCPQCHLGYRRSSLQVHLQRHGWPAQRAKSAARVAPVVSADAVKRSSVGGSVPRSKPSSETATKKNRSPNGRWPQLERTNVIDYIRRHPGTTSREIAEALMGDDVPRPASKAASNRCEALVIKGTLRYEIGAGPHGPVRRYYVAESSTPAPEPQPEPIVESSNVWSEPPRITFADAAARLSAIET